MKPGQESIARKTSKVMRKNAGQSSSKSQLTARSGQRGVQAAKVAAASRGHVVSTRANLSWVMVPMVTTFCHRRANERAFRSMADAKPNKNTGQKALHHARKLSHFQQGEVILPLALPVELEHRLPHGADARRVVQRQQLGARRANQQQLLVGRLCKQGGGGAVVVVSSRRNKSVSQESTKAAGALATWSGGAFVAGDFGRAPHDPKLHAADGHRALSRPKTKIR